MQGEPKDQRVGLSPKEDTVRLRSALCTRYVLVIAALVAFAAPPGQAAEFDARLQAPQLMSPAQIKQGFADRLNRSDGLRTVERLRDENAATQWLDLKWQLNRLAQAGQALPDLSEFGLEREGAAYTVDVAQHPRWELWDVKLSLLEDPAIFEVHAQRLRERGFSEDSLARLKEYVTRNPLARTTLRAEQSLVQSIRSQRAKSPQLKQSLDVSRAAAYVYQLERARERARGQWVAAALEQLDAQSQRVLASFYQELGGSITFWPEAQFDRGVAAAAQSIVSGSYEQHLLQKEQELRQ